MKGGFLVLAMTTISYLYLLFRYLGKSWCGIVVFSRNHVRYCSIRTPLMPPLKRSNLKSNNTAIRFFILQSWASILFSLSCKNKRRYFYSFEVLVSFINFIFNSLKRFSHGTSTDCFSLHHSRLKNLPEEGEEMTNWTHMASTPGVVPGPHGRRQVTTALSVISTRLPSRRSRAQTLPGQTLRVLK